MKAAYGVPDPRPARGARGRPASRARRSAAASAARNPPHAREPGRVARRPDRPAVRRGAAVRLPRAFSRSTCHGCARRSSPTEGGEQTGMIVTKAPGYLVRVERDELDLERFERLAEEGRQALLDASPEAARELLVEAPRALAGPGARRLRVRAVRAGRERGGSRSSGSQRSRTVSRPTSPSDARPRSSARSKGWCGAVPAARAAARSAHARAVPLRTAGRGARCVPGRAARARRRPRARAERGAAGARAGDPPPGSVARHSTAARARTQPPSARSCCCRWRPKRSARLVALAKPLTETEPPRELVLARLVFDSRGASALGGARFIGARDELLSGRCLRARAACFTSDAEAADAARLASEHERRPRLRSPAVDLVDALPRGLLGELIETAPCDVAALANADQAEDSAARSRSVRRSRARLGGPRAGCLARRRSRPRAPADRATRRPGRRAARLEQAPRACFASRAALRGGRSRACSGRARPGRGNRRSRGRRARHGFAIRALARGGPRHDPRRSSSRAPTGPSFSPLAACARAGLRRARA